MKNQLVCSIPITTSSNSQSISYENNNDIISFVDDGCSSCSLEGNIGVDNFISLHDYFQHLSHIPLGHATATPSPPPPVPAPTQAGICNLEEGHNKPIHDVVAQGYQTMETQMKGVVKPHSKGKQLRNPEGIHMPLQDDEYVHNSQPRGQQKFNDVNVVNVVKAIKGYSKGKQPPEFKQADNQYASSSKRNSQRRSSEHKRRQRINAKMKAMQALVPTCDKGDHASILDHTIKYIKSMKLHIHHMMSRSIEQSQLQNLYAPQVMMQPTMVVPRLGYGSWPSPMSPPGYTYMATPSGDVTVPIQPASQAQAQIQTPGNFASILCPLQYLSTTIPTPATPTVMSFVPPMPQFTPSNTYDASHIQLPN